MLMEFQFWRHDHLVVKWCDAGKGQVTQSCSFCLQIFEKCGFLLMMKNGTLLSVVAREGRCVEALSLVLAS
jgi:hypothetical protein